MSEALEKQPVPGPAAPPPEVGEAKDQPEVKLAAPAEQPPEEPVTQAEVEVKPQPYWNSYVAGAALGLVLLAAFVFTGRGLGASGAATRVAAWGLQKTEMALKGGTHAAHETWASHSPYAAQYVAGDKDVFDDFLVYMLLGILVGGFLSGITSGRFRFEFVKGALTTNKRRIFFAVLGGVVSAFGARLARGCTSGQALTGGATLAVGSWVFMLAVFAGGYLLAYPLRKEWR